MTDRVGAEPWSEEAYNAIFAEHERDHQDWSEPREGCVGCRMLAMLARVREERDDARTARDRANSALADDREDHAGDFDEIVRLRARVAALEGQQEELRMMVHQPNPTDPSRWDVAPGQHRKFSAFCAALADRREPTA